MLYQLSHRGSPRILEWVAFPFSSRSSQPRDGTRVCCIAGRFFTHWAIREARLQVNFNLKNSSTWKGLRVSVFLKKKKKECLFLKVSRGHPIQSCNLSLTEGLDVIFFSLSIPQFFSKFSRLKNDVKILFCNARIYLRRVILEDV